MKSFLKKLHIMPRQSENSEGSSSSKGVSKSSTVSPDRSSQSRSNTMSENKPLSGLSSWLNSVTNRKSPSPPTPSNAGRGERIETSDSVSSSGLDVVVDAVLRESESSTLRDPEVEEEYQIQLALELSAREDPEAVQIEAVKQISLGSCTPENTPAEVVAYRYWNYNALSYDDKILDGFYDVYGVISDSSSEKMPSLVDLQGTVVSDNILWEAVLVNRSADANLVNIEKKAREMALKMRSECSSSCGSDLVRKLAVLVSDSMGGPVGDPDKLLRAWRNLSHSLKSAIGSMVLPLGSLTVGLARHRALLFKILADDVGIKCRLVKGQQYTGSDDVAMNFVKIDEEREYIVDLMADPGTLIPADAAGSHIEYDDSLSSQSPLSADVDSSQVVSSSSGAHSSFEKHSHFGTFGKKYGEKSAATSGKEFSDRDEVRIRESTISETHAEEFKMSDKFQKFSVADRALVRDLPSKPGYPMHARSPSWTEGLSSPAVRRMKVKDVSQYMIDAAKENPELAQKLHNVLLESGVVAPANLFSEITHELLEVSSSNDDKDESRKKKGPHVSPPASYNHGKQSEQLMPVEGLGAPLPLDLREPRGPRVSSPSDATHMKLANKVPVAAAAAAAAAVVASSMVAAVAAKSSAANQLELPVAAVTATAAAVVATTAAVSNQIDYIRNDGDADNIGHEQRGSGGRQHDTYGSEGERKSDRSTGSAKSDVALDDDVAECEIPWEEISLGERIGLGSYGEVYRGDWHGTEVAVKRFLDQSITGESLEEFKSEVRIMRRVRHPNVVLFMGAVTRPPNLSIITEFLPRGSLYRLLHRPNNQLDERRRLRMALDAARGMNYLHNCTPVIVHRDLKSPNLLVDKNWVVKVCDFGLSRMKHSTFLSSRSTAGTAEWMAPEVLRNEPSDEKCDVYSFGVILWELATMRQPWGGMNPMQVVGAVGFQHRRLEIPDDIDPAVADIIRQCWQTDPRLRPSFGEIMAALKPLQKPITSNTTRHQGHQ
uniref:non-specific serine/threonine protein kinase n=2 Tax=Kalanchoe fedtschenkoi TaxID=63787 RepID=A0A7N1A6Q1_KALFE